MWLGHDSSWWAIVLAIAALVLMIPASVVSNILTPLLLNWLATWSSASLEKRIAKLENHLAELEKNPAIDEVQEHILWGITSLRMMGLSLASGLVLVFRLGMDLVADQTSYAYKRLNVLTFAIVVVNGIAIFMLRYAHDFRYKRSPTLRKQLRKAIDDLKTLRRPQ